MAITRLGPNQSVNLANNVTGTLPAANVANSTLNNVTALPAAISTGKVLQVVSVDYGTQVTSTANSYSDTGLTASITPSSSSNKILVHVLQSVGKTASNTWTDIKLQRGSTDISIVKSITYNAVAQANYVGTGGGFIILDNPSTTSETTYKTVFRNVAAAGTIYTQVDSGKSMMTLMEIKI